MSSVGRPIRLGVAGAAGRMGRSVLRLAREHDRFDVVAALTALDDPLVNTPASVGGGTLLLSAQLDVPCDVLIEFTDGHGTAAWTRVCRERNIALVVGSTGHDPATIALLREAAGDIPILCAANFSLGVNLLLQLVGTLADTLGPGYDVELVEAHHRAKIDAPSGTALAMVEKICQATGRDPITDVAHGRQGHTGPRARGQIGVHALRMGDMVGRHELHFSGGGETITLSHSVHTRGHVRIRFTSRRPVAGRSRAWLVHDERRVEAC